MGIPETTVADEQVDDSVSVGVMLGLVNASGDADGDTCRRGGRGGSRLGPEGVEAAEKEGKPSAVMTEDAGGERRETV